MASAGRASSGRGMRVCLWETEAWSVSDHGRGDGKRGLGFPLRKISPMAVRRRSQENAVYVV